MKGIPKTQFDKPLYMTRPATKQPAETLLVSECCGASPTEYCNDDTGFCPDCRDHTEFIAVCVECNEQECECVQCILDTGCGETPCICQADEHFDRNVATDSRGMIQI